MHVHGKPALDESQLLLRESSVVSMLPFIRLIYWVVT